MKKLLSLLLSIIILISSFSQGLISFATDVESNSDLYTFADDLTSLVRDYSEEENSTDETVFEDLVVAVGKFFSAPQMSENDSLPLSSFETKRLIVKSEKKIDYFGAVECISGYNDLYILQYDTMLDAKTAYEQYLELAYVEYVEPDIIMSASGDFPDDIIDEEDVSNLDKITAEAMDWLQDKLGFDDIQEELEKLIADDYVLVAVLDSGVDMDHEQLVDRIVETNINFSSSGAIDSCEDDYGHGSHVAGIIANNTLGNVKIKPYKVLNNSGKGSLSVIATAIDMAVADGADIVNLSLSAINESERMTEAVDNAVANDVNVVVAAGNNSADLDKVYYSPSCIDSAITVSATDNNDKLASFSNYGGPIDIAAPGVNIRSCFLNNSYVTMSGTSMAAPQVTAGLAIIHTVFAGITAAEAEQRIKDYAIPLYEEEGHNYFGAGLVFLRYLLDEKPTTSNPVFSVDSCTFSEKFELTITCYEPDVKIFYLMTRLGEGEFADWIKADEYTKPITISVDTKIYAIAYSKGKNLSDIVEAEYDRVVDSEEENYEINALGYITAYYGNEINLVIPGTINGRKVNGIASSAFKNDSRLRTVILPDSATKINSMAFQGCSALVSVSGKEVTEISSNAFEKSSIQSFDFPNLKKIGYKAFSNCSELTTASMTKVESIGDYSFEKTPGITELNLENTTEIGMSAFSESGVKSVNFPKVTSIGMNAFADCENLIEVSIPQLTELTIGVFKNCTSLKSVNIPLLKVVGANAFRNTGLESYFGRHVETIGNYAFAESVCLAEVILPLTKSSGTNTFSNCPDLQVVMLPSIVELNNNSFYNCPKLKMLYLPAVKTVSATAFLQSSIEYLRFNQVETIKSLPQTLKGIVLPSTLTSITAITPNNDFIVYGYENTYAQQYANDKNKEFHTVPTILYETVEEFNPDDTYIVVYAMGFGCEYQWYKNDTISNEGGTPIDGANYFYYEPTAEDNATVYYCVITSSDGVNTNSITTNPILNAPKLRPADLGGYNDILEEVSALDRESVDKELLFELDELINIDFSKFTYDSQYLVDYVVQEIKFILFEINYGLMLGDINHDNKISAYDARMILRYASGTANFSKQQQRAADMNGDGEISTIDARLVLTHSIES